MTEAEKKANKTITMSAETFYKEWKEKENYKSLTKLTSTGISDNWQTAFEFAESYFIHRIESITDEMIKNNNMYFKNDHRHKSFNNGAKWLKNEYLKTTK